MDAKVIEQIILNQKAYFKEGNTLDVKYRREKLKQLKVVIKKYENDLLEALHKDLGKAEHEAYMCEVGLVYDDINFMVKNIKKLSAKKKYKTPLAQFKSKSYQIPSPYGVVLVMSPWNYPFLLSLDPLVEAFAAGNTVILKTSEYSRHTNIVVKTIIEEVFDPKECAVILGGLEENKALIASTFDYIFFTGSKNVGHIVYNSAASKMTPVTLELGGKSPCIVDETANIELAAKRIIFGKLLNCGQTCVAPDYLFAHKEIKEKLIQELIKQIKLQYSENVFENDKYGKIITPMHYERIKGLIDYDKVIYGGKYNNDTCQIEPTLINNVTFDDKIMGEEIFGPLLPIIEFENIDEIIEYVNNNDSPLALYYFSRNKERVEKMMKRARYGGGCVNDTIIHLATSNLSFGGVGASGIGQYHGKKGFETFTHYKSIVDKACFIDLPMRYQPYNKKYTKLIKKIMR